MKKFLFNLFKWSLTIGLVWFALHSIEDQTQNLGEHFWHSFQNMNWSWIGLAFITLNTSFILSTGQWWFLLRRQDIVLKPLKCIRLYYVGLFFNNFMPGNTGGDIKKIYDVNKDTKQLAASVTATLSDRIFGLFALNLYSLIIGLCFFYSTPKFNTLILPSLWIFLVMMFLFIAFYSTRISSWFESRLRQFKLEYVASKFFSLRTSFQRYKGMKFWFKILILAMTTQALRILVFYFVSLGLGMTAEPIYYFYLIPIIGIVTALPISIGGFGPREVLTQTLFAWCAMSSLDCLLMQIWALIIFTSVSLLGGIDFAFSKRKIQDQS